MCACLNALVIDVGLQGLFYVWFLQLLDLCILDINSLEFHYGVLAAAAFCHFSSFEVVHKVSGTEFIDMHFRLSDLSPNSSLCLKVSCNCVVWT